MNSNTQNAKGASPTDTDELNFKLQHWLENVTDPELLAELDKMAKSGDQTAIRDAFYQDLAFGTAGLRGILGAGSNRMNVYTVAKATQGLATYLLANAKDGERPSVAVTI